MSTATETTKRPRLSAAPTILLVDDEVGVLHGFQRIMSTLQADWHVVACTSAELALQRLAVERFDAVVSDLQMPGMSGMTLLAQVSMRHPETLRVIHSSQLDTFSAGGVRYLSHYVLVKPASTMEIMKMTKWVNESRAASTQCA
jgi:DNA-binding NtrC family response regulator